MTKFDCSPSGPQGYIRAAEANNQTSTVDFLTELFDNSIDAGARNITAEVAGTSKGRGKGSFRITDDGSGVENIQVLLRLGESTKEGGGHIGRFGVGAKDCIYSIGGLSSTLDIQSRSRGGACWRSSIAWASQRDWNFAQEDCPPDDADLSTPTGVRITMSRCHRAMTDAPKLRAHLSRVHWPWLEKARHRMTVNGEAVTAPSKPRTDDRFKPDVEVRVDEHRWLTLEGGILKADDELNGVTVFHGNRAIYVADAIGTGDYSRSGIFALVRLYGRWSLERNKRGLDEQDAEVLRAALEVELRAALEEACDRMRELHDDSMLNRINEQFAGIQFGQPKRPNRNGEKRKPPAEPTERKVREAAVVGDAGDARQRRARRRSNPYRIEFVTGDVRSVGQVDADNRRIALHKNNRSIASLRQQGDERGILMVAAFLLANHRERNEGGLPFPEVAGTLIATILEVGSHEVA